MKKKIIAITAAMMAVIIASVVGLTGCAGKKEADTGFQWNGQKEVWAILPTTGVPGLMIHADSMGYLMEKAGFTYVTKDAEGNPSKQVDFVEDAIAAGNVGALMIAAMDVTMLQDVVEEAQEKGIAVAMLGAEPKDYQVSGCVYTAYEITGMYAVQAAEDWAEKRSAEKGSNVPVNKDGKYEIAIDYYTDIEDGIYRSNAMVGTIKASDSLELVSATQAYGNSAQTDAYDNAQTVLAAHPDCRIFIAYEPDEAMGIAAAVADYAETNKLDLADFCVIPCYSEDDTFLEMWKQADENHSANAIKGYATYGDSATEEEIADFAKNGNTTSGMEFSATGRKLATILLDVCGQDGYEWEYGSTFYDSISAVNVYGFEKKWSQGDENPAIQYKVSEYIG